MSCHVPFAALEQWQRCVTPLTVISPWSWQYRSRSIPIIKPKPTVSQDLTESTTRRIFIYGIQDDNSTDTQSFFLDLTPPPDVVFRTLPGTSDGMNVLGIVIFSATMGKFMFLDSLWTGVQEITRKILVSSIIISSNCQATVRMDDLKSLKQRLP